QSTRSFSIVYTPTPPTKSRTLSLHDALPIFTLGGGASGSTATVSIGAGGSLLLNIGGVTYNATNNPNGATISGGTLGLNFTAVRSEEHTSELQSRQHLVCRLLLEKKKRTCNR